MLQEAKYVIYENLRLQVCKNVIIIQKFMLAVEVHKFGFCSSNIRKKLLMEAKK